MADKNSIVTRLKQLKVMHLLAAFKDATNPKKVNAHRGWIDENEMKSIVLVAAAKGPKGIGKTEWHGLQTIASYEKMGPLAKKYFAQLEARWNLAKRMNFAQHLVRIAKKEVGVVEGKSNNTGKDVEKYQKATWLTPGPWPWCAAFVCWCYQQALNAHPIAAVNRPQTAAAWDFERWAKTQKKCHLNKPPVTVLAGDIVVFTFSHIGIAVANEKNGEVITVEGNTNVKGTRDGAGKLIDGVYRKTRAKSKIRSTIRTDDS